MTKTIKKVVIFLSILYFLIPSFVVLRAVSVGDQLQAVIDNTGTYEVGANEDSLIIAIGKIINVILGFLGVIFLVLIIYGGFIWMTAQGNEAQVEKAKKILIRSTVGVIIILISFIITWFIMGTLSTIINNL